jgi:iron complex outermembrane receptor protein
MDHLFSINRLPRIFVAGLFLFGIFSVTTLPAQEPDEDEIQIEEVIITGSRIPQDPLNQRLPVLTLTQEDIRATGVTSLAEFIQRLPISGSAINGSNNSSGNLGFPPDGGGIGAGAAQIDLRYLGAKRVLVLVDGRRWIKGSSGSGVSGAVDLNSIPVNAVKSIEILQDGSSAIYGSDALGGVVNIITQDDFESLKASAYYGQYEQGDGETKEFDVRMGASGERGRVLLDVAYADQKNVDTADRKTSRYPLPGFEHGISSGTPFGRFVFTDPILGDVSVAPDGQFPVWNPLDPDNDDFHDFTLDDRFNYQPFNHLITPNERLNIFSKAEYDLTENTMLRMLASFNNRKSQGRAAPVPLFFGPDSGSTPYMVDLFWPADQEFNPFGIDLGPDNISFFGRRPIEAGPRIFNQNVNTWYVSTGIDGNFRAGSRLMYWDVTAIWSENSAKQTKLNQFNARSINVAMGPPEICAVTPGCVPLNIVGAGSITPEMLDFVTYTGIDTSKQKMKDFTANLAGDVFDLPAGPIDFAFGFEYREEKGSFTPDPVVAAGETADVPTSPTVGKFDVKEFYGEVIVPILADRKGAEILNLSGALRYTNYDLFDSDTIGKIGINWGPTSNLMIRASYSEGFRAPNIGELFNQGSRFDASITDRCSNVAPADAANCAALGVPPDYSQLNPQISVDTGGNPDLEPETSNTWSAGFSWNIPVDGWNGVDNFLAELNYYNIEVDGAIQAPDGQDLLDGCIDTLQDIFCDAINRNPGGTITSIGGVLQNIAGIETSGIDVNLNLATVESNFGQFRFQWMTSFLLDYDDLITNSEGGITKIAREGTELGSPSRGFIETKSTLNTDWFKNDWYVRLAFRYQSSLTEQCVGLVADFEQTQMCSNGPDTNKLGSVIYTDLQASWTPSNLNNGGWTFSAGVNNLFNEKPPICYSCDLNSLDGTLYAIAGQFWYLRVIYEM